MAWPSSSRTSTPAPSPRTNPQRSSSKGLEALAGSSLYLALRAFILYLHRSWAELPLCRSVSALYTVLSLRATVMPVSHDMCKESPSMLIANM